MQDERKRAERAREVDRDNYDENSYFLCPVINIRVDPEFFINNTRIKEAVEKFLQ